jgi:predicted ATPase/class 3 adenylate cyclase
MRDIAEWLAGLGLGRYGEAFAENDVDAEVLPHMTNDDLKDLGVASVGHRRKLLQAIAALSAPEGGPAETAAAGEGGPADRPAVEAERRQMTVMFCDLVGSTALSQRLDPEDLREVMRRYQDAIAGAVSRYGGHVAKYLGDGVLAFFGWPVAHEDQAERAVRAGLDAISAVSGLSFDGEVRLAARVGIATGQVVVGDLVGEVGREAEAVSGETPNLAARLQAAAEPNQVVIGATTRRLVGNAFRLDDLGQRELKGFSEAVSLWRVAGEGTAESRFEVTHGATLSPLVGREHELGLLLDRWALARGGEGQVVELSGEAGIGKSRLVRALQEAAGETPYFRLRYQCSPHHTNSAYYPIIQRLERAAGFAAADDPEVRLDKLEALLRLSGQDIASAVPWFAALLSLPGEGRYGKLELTPEQRRERTTAALVEQVLALARQKPVLFVLEDAHWIDPTTRELLKQIAARIAEAPVMLLITYRQGQAEPLVGLSNLTSVTLSRLSRAQGRAIIRAAGGAAFPDQVRDRIVSRSDGVPLYVEELTRAVAEAGAGVGALDIPDTLQASLLARLDRLEEAKEVVQIGAVIGRDFGYELLAAAVGKPEAELADALDRMVRSELVYRHGAPPEATYTFKHALVQDAAYRSLLKRRRQTVHRQVAELLESRFPEIAQTQPELVAHHFTEAGLAERSVAYWYEAGQQALQSSAHLEAIAHLTKGRARLAERSDGAEKEARELDFCLALGPAFMATKGLASPEAEEVYLRARELCRAIGETALSFQATWGLWLVRQQRGQITLAQALTDEMLSLAKQQKDNTEHLLQAHHAAWTTELFVGHISTSRAHVADGFALYDFAAHRHHAFTYGGHDPGVCAKTTGSEALCLLGYVEQATKTAVEAVELAEKLAHPFSLAMARYFVAQVHQYRREAEAVQRHAQAAISLCESHGFASFRAQATVLSGWATAACGDLDGGIAGIRAGLTAWQATGTGMRRPYFLALLADALLCAERADEGLAVIAEAEALIDNSGETRWQAETLRLQGALMGQAGAPADEVAATYRRALEVARGQEARLLELRAATSLGRLLSEQGRAGEARDLVAPIRDWFSEGVEAPDLKDASALLAELA